MALYGGRGGGGALLSGVGWWGGLLLREDIRRGQGQTRCFYWVAVEGRLLILSVVAGRFIRREVITNKELPFTGALLTSENRRLLAAYPYRPYRILHDLPAGNVSLPAFVNFWWLARYMPVPGVATSFSLDSSDFKINPLTLSP